MGCGGSKDSSAGPLTEAEAEVKKNPQVKLQGGNYLLSQSVAIVRHGDRLDHTLGWKDSPMRAKFPNDTPLTADGMAHATEAGAALKKTGAAWGLIVASPYLRCAQTASCIAKVLNLPIHFDIDIGEVFDNISMTGTVTGSQIRSPAELEAELVKDFQGVEWLRDETGAIKINGKQQDFPEHFDAARMRYAYKVKKLVQKAAAQLTSIVIVTHGDGVGACLGMMKENLQILKVDYTAYVYATRQVRVLEKGSDQIIEEEPVYVDQAMWKVQLSPGLKVKEVEGRQKQLAHEMHSKEMKAMNAKQDMLGTATYILDDVTTKQMRAALARLNAHPDDETALMERTAGCEAFTKERTASDRIMCAPHAATNKDSE